MKPTFRTVFAVTVLSSASFCRAVTIMDDFNDGNNVGWTDISPLSGFGAPTAYSYPGGNTYTLSIGASPNPSAVGASRGGSVRNDATYSQFLTTVDVLNWDVGGGTNMVAGLLARLGTIGLGTTNGYGFFYESAGTLTIARIAAENSTTLTSTPLSLTSGTGYRFVFSGNGTAFDGQVFALSDLGTPLASISTTDATYSSGVNGLFVYDATSPATSANHTPSATFDNYFSAVPEPGTSVVALAALGMFLRRRK